MHVLYMYMYYMYVPHAHDHDVGACTIEALEMLYTVQMQCNTVTLTSNVISVPERFLPLSKLCT